MCGSDKQRVIDFIYELVELKNDLISQCIAELGFSSVLLLMMEKYYSNSVLHLKIYNLFAEAIHSNIDYMTNAV